MESERYFLLNIDEDDRDKDIEAQIKRLGKQYGAFKVFNTQPQAN